MKALRYMGMTKFPIIEIDDVKIKVIIGEGQWL